MLTKHQEALRLITTSLHKEQIEWALGGSALLSVYGLTERTNDLDLFVSAQDVLRAHEVLQKLGEYTVMAPKEPYCTVHFLHYTIAGTEVDLMGLFGIRHEEGVYRLDWRRHEQDQTLPLPVEGTEETLDIPLASLEDWYILYSLIPGRSAKAEAIEGYWEHAGGPEPERLREALSRELPHTLRRRIQLLLGAAGAHDEQEIV
ncbi:hypothetical protein WMW72_22580 [Paenibacillus filicis]|uniref:Uncharacterized protein n=1 Tax=Paenibacillus filicis TaxID=669464 RepID=A0ABU9DRJ2_9BACL